MKETEMHDDPEITAVLYRLAAGDPLDPIDPLVMLNRGRRGRRRRRVLSISGVVAGVAAVAIGAAVLPGAIDRAEPEIAKSPSPFTPVAGVPQGEAALGKLTKQESLRRCAIRYGEQRLAVFMPQWYEAGKFLPPARDDSYGPGDACIIPGDSRPSAELIAKAKSDPVPQSTDDLLLNCSVQFWHDLTKWRVISTQRVAGRGLRLLALSPTGRHALTCDLLTNGDASWTSPGGIRTTQDEQRLSLAGVVGGVGVGSPCKAQPCAGWIYHNTGRVDPAITRIQLKALNGRTHDITVVDGWFSLYWANGDLQVRKSVTITAYDAAGGVVATATVPG